MSSSSKVTLVFGALLLGLGALFLAAQFIGGSVWSYLWPVFVLLAGGAFFTGMLLGGKPVSGLAIPGSIITMIGLILLIQNSFGLWHTWSYAWALIVAAVGIGLYIHGAYSGDDTTRRVGTQLTAFGAVLFLVFGAFFELGAALLGRQSASGIVWAVALIAAGVYFLVRRSGSAAGPLTNEVVDLAAGDSIHPAGFTRIAHRGIGDLTLTQAPAHELRIEASQQMRRYLKAEVKDGTLEIRFDYDWADFFGWMFMSWGPVKIYVSMPVIESIGLHGAGNLEAASIEASSLEVKLSGAGNVKFGALNVTDRLTLALSGAGNLSAETLTAGSIAAHLSGAGNLELHSGKAERQEVHQSGAGNYTADQLECQDAVVHHSGVGNSAVWAVRTLDVSMSGVGNVNYRGQPQLTTKKSGVGNLNHRD